MDLDLVRKGFCLGFVVAAPVGPIGLIVMRRSLEGGALAGLVTGLGAAVSDAMYAGAGALGFAAATSVLAGSPVFRWGGAVLLAYLGVRTLLSEPPGTASSQRASPASHGKAFASTLLLTLANPATILSFAAAFAAIGAGVATRSSSLVFAVTVFCGSMAWWAILCGAIGGLRSRLPRALLRAINVASGIAVLALAVLALRL